MLLRKIYLKTRLYLYSIRGFTNKIIVSIMIAVLAYFFLNSFVVGRIIVGKANYDQINRQYDSAITFYNIAYAYYGLNHFSKENKNLYFKLPFEISMCYQLKNDSKHAKGTILEGITNVQKQYGIFSQETAYFIRKYLIQYYIETDNIKSAKQEFNNLVSIYKKIGYDENVISNLMALSGDLYYAQKNYIEAMKRYERFYHSLPDRNSIDYESFAKIVVRMCDSEIAKNNTKKAINIYKNALTVLKTPRKEENALVAMMLINLGDLYIKNNSTKDAISSYVEAISIINRLPRATYLRQNIMEYLTTLKELYTEDSQPHKAKEIEMEITQKRRFSFL